MLLEWHCFYRFLSDYSLLVYGNNINFVFFLLALYSSNFVNLLISSSSFLEDSFGFSKWIIMPPEN